MKDSHVKGPVKTIKVFKPTSPGVRHKAVWQSMRVGPQEVPKALRVSMPKSGGRNNTGHISAFHIGGGGKVLSRQLTRSPRWTEAVVEAIQIDPHRSAPIARIRIVPMVTPEEQMLVAKIEKAMADMEALASMPRPVDTGEFLTCLVEISRIRAKRRVMLVERRDLQDARQSLSRQEYVVAGRGMVPGMTIYAGAMAPFKDHSRRPRSMIPVGSHVYDLEIVPGKGSQRVKSAGTFAERIRRDDSTHQTLIRLPSKGLRWVPDTCVACIGHVAGEDHMLKVAGKAGINRRKGIRPTVRGVAMNPIDHPHGGRTGGGRPEVTPWSKVAKGRPTRSRRKHSVYVVKA